MTTQRVLVTSLIVLAVTHLVAAAAGLSDASPLRALAFAAAAAVAHATRAMTAPAVNLRELACYVSAVMATATVVVVTAALIVTAVVG